MTEVVYSSTKLPKKVDIPTFNASHFPCHADDVDTVYLNGSFPAIEELCKSGGIECKPFSEFKPKQKPKTSKGEE